MKMFKKVMCLLAVFVLSISFAACSSSPKKEPDINSASSDDEIIINGEYEVDSNGNIVPESVLKPKPTNKRLTPDVSSVILAAPSSSPIYSNTEEECIDRLRIFSNPNGNEYDALALLGEFKYSHKTNEEMMEQLKNASKQWHDEITRLVGEKCITTMSITKKTPIDLSDEKAVNWQKANSPQLEAYTNIKCAVSTNYADNELKISLDLVKVGGKWYLANAGTLDKIKTTITTDLFR